MGSGVKSILATAPTTSPVGARNNTKSSGPGIMGETQAIMIMIWATPATNW